MEQTGYLDLHSHILPGVDDGSKDWEMTMQMLQMIYDQGVRHIVATPHNYPGQKKQDNEKIRALAEEVNQRAKQIASDFEVLCGNEVLYRRGIPQEIEDNHVLTLADSRYLLVEFYPDERYDDVYQGLRELIESGYRPVIAHMERVHALFEKEENIWEVIKLGALVQVNTKSLMGGLFDRRSARLRKYMENGMIHFLGSDCHNTAERAPLMEDCIEKLRKKLPESCLNRILCENRDQFLQKKYI